VTESLGAPLARFVGLSFGRALGIQWGALFGERVPLVRCQVYNPLLYPHNLSLR
jgi:hypothetical protein